MKLTISSKGKTQFNITCKINGIDSTVSIASDKLDEKEFMSIIKSKLGQNIIIENMVVSKKEL